MAVPLNWHLHPDEVDYVVRHCSAAAIVVATQTEPATRTLPGDVAVVRVPYDPDLLHGEPLGLTGAARGDPAWLFYTSGTTGRPKGATLTHGNLRAMTTAYHADLDPVAPGSVYLHAAQGPQAPPANLIRSARPVTAGCFPSTVAPTKKSGAVA